MGKKKVAAKTETTAAHTHTSAPVESEASKGRDNSKDEAKTEASKAEAKAKTVTLVRDTENVENGVKHDPPYSADVDVREVSNWLDARYPKREGDPRSGSSMGWRHK